MKTKHFLSILILLSSFFLESAQAGPKAEPSELGYNSPHFTEYTCKVPVPEGTEIEAVNEGIVTLRCQNKLAFYSIAEGRMLWDFVWQGVGRYGSKAVFSGGACAVKRDGEYYILYPDGKEKNVSQLGVKEIGPFHDGIAVGKKKKGDWGSSPAFFDKNGSSIFDALVTNAGAYAELDLRSISDGLRAVQLGKWGFMDANGKMVIPAKYSRVSDFSEGIALVSSGKGLFGIIDKKGKVLLDESIQGGYQDPRAFHDGLAFLPANNRFTDTKGKLVDVSAGCSDFSAGWCFSTIDYTEAGLISKDFSTKKILKSPDGGALHTSREAPTHPVKGHFLLEDYGNAYIFDMNGKLCLASNDKNCKISALFEDASVALCYSLSGDPYSIDAVAVCNLDGEVIVIFDAKNSFPNVKDNPIKKPRAPEPVKPEPVEPKPIEQPVKPEPEKPKKQVDTGTPPTDEKGNLLAVLKDFEINIEGEWPEGKKASASDVIIYSNILPGDVCKPGDTLRFSVNPPEYGRVKEPKINGKKVITQAPGVYKAVLPKGYSTVSVGIVAEEKLDMHTKYALKGNRVFTFQRDGVSNLDAEVLLYTEPDGIAGTPFGESVNGLFIVDFDQSKKLTAYWNRNQDEPIKDFASYYWGPYKVVGFSEEEGKKYIHLSGGIVAIGNWMDQKDTDLGGLLITLFVSLSSFNEDNTGGDPTYVILNLPHKFRLSYTDLPDGGIKLGLFERFSTAFGWVPSNDKRLIKKKSKNYGFMTFTESSEARMEPDILNGVELHPAVRPDGLPSFYPGRNWFLDEEQYKHTVGVFNRMYGAQGDKNFGERWYTREECEVFIRDYVVRWGMKQLKNE